MGSPTAGLEGSISEDPESPEGSAGVKGLEKSLIVKHYGSPGAGYYLRLWMRVLSKSSTTWRRVSVGALHSETSEAHSVNCFRFEFFILP